MNHPRSFEEESRRTDKVLAVATLAAILLVSSIDDIERHLHKLLDPVGYQKVLEENDGTYPPSFSD